MVRVMTRETHRHSIHGPKIAPLILGTLLTVMGCDFIPEGAYPTLSGEYRILDSSVSFSGYQNSEIPWADQSKAASSALPVIRQPQTFPFPVNLPERIEILMEPLNQSGYSDYQVNILALVDVEGVRGQLLKTKLQSDGSAQFALIQGVQFDDATSPAYGIGEGYACRWEVGATYSIQFNRNLSDFSKVYPSCEWTQGENREKPICVSPGAGHEADLPVHAMELDLKNRLRFELKLTVFRRLRVDSSPFLCIENSNYSTLQTGNTVTATYEIDIPNWYLGDPRIVDNPLMVDEIKSRVSELTPAGESSVPVVVHQVFGVPQDAFELESRYPPIEWKAPSTSSPGDGTDF